MKNNGMCEDCTFASRDPKGILICRRYPPQAHYVTRSVFAAEGVTTTFPTIRLDDWCGEWKSEE